MMSKGLLLAAAAAGPAPPALQQLFASDRSKHSWSRGKYICYRNPSLVAANGALLAFASGVNAGGCDDSVVSVPGSSTLYYSHPDAAKTSFRILLAAEKRLTVPTIVFQR